MLDTIKMSNMPAYPVDIEYLKKCWFRDTDKRIRSVSTLRLECFWLLPIMPEMGWVHICIGNRDGDNFVTNEVYYMHSPTETPEGKYGDDFVILPE